MTDATKRRAILFLILTALITVLLAVALPQLELQQGVPLPARTSPAEAAPPDMGEPPPTININTFFGTVAGLFFLIVFIFLIVRRGRRWNWRDILQVLFSSAMLSLVLTMLIYALSNIKVSAAPSTVEILPPEVAVVAVGPPLAPIPSFLLWVVGIGLAGLALLLVIMTARVRIQHKITEDQDLLVLEAEQAVKAIKAGQDLSNVIIRCYRQMSVVLKKEHGLTLEETMTAREFEALLEKRGVPNPPVRELTRLFEIARYAAHAPGSTEEAQAVECLNAIAQYSRKKEPDQPK